MNKIEEAIAKITHLNHHDHIIRTLPIITMVYAAQLFILFEMNKGVGIGNYALFLGGLIISFVTFLTYYDRHHQTILFQSYLHIYHPFMARDEVISYSEIKEVHAPEQESRFANLVIELHSGSRTVLYFVDFPLEVKKTLEGLMKPKQKKEDSEENPPAEAA